MPGTARSEAVLSVNAAICWYALRKMGINDPIPGYGKLLLETGIVG